MSNDVIIPEHGTTALAFFERTGETDQDLQRYIRRGLIAVAVLVFGVGGLAATLPMAGAVIAPGQISVESFIKPIGHPFGGVVADILVKDGDRVTANQPLIRLDSKVSGANSSLTGQNVDQLMAREARLVAERDGLASIPFAKELLARAGDPVVAAIIADERRNFAVRRAASLSQVAQFTQRARQARADIAAYNSQLASYNQQSELISQELDQTRSLYRERLTTLDRLNALERSAVGVRANRDTAAANIAQSAARIGEYQAQTVMVGTGARSLAAAELVEVQATLAELKRQKVTADDNFDRTVIRAPQAGVVDKLAIKTVGAVVPAGQTIMDIVPDTDRLTVRANVGTSDIDQINLDQKAVVRLIGLSMRTTPELNGKVTYVSADKTVEESGAAYYRVTIEIPPSEIQRIRDVKLRVGMPVESFIQTSERTMLSFLTRPLMQQIRRAFRAD